MPCFYFACRQERGQLEALVESLRLERSALETREQESTSNCEQAVVAAAAAAAEAASKTQDLEKQVETLLNDAGALEHRLVGTQQERDAAVARASELEEELARLGAGTEEAAAASAEAASTTQDLEKQVEALLNDAGDLEHRLVGAQQERDAAVARSSELEEEVARIGAGADEAATAAAAALEAAEAKAASAIAEAEARCAASVDAVREEMAEEKARLEEAASEQRLALEQALAESERLRSETAGVREAAEGAGAGIKGELDEARAELEQARGRVEAVEREANQAARDKVSDSERGEVCVRLLDRLWLS